MLEYDIVIIGSGFGGAMMAERMAGHGKKVAVIERGDWVERGTHNWHKTGSIDLTKYYDKSIPYNVIKGGNKKQMGVYAAVGGPSSFYGGVSFRFREKDFSPPDEIIGDSKAEWPIDYNDLSPYYDEAEKILNIAGESGVDPTEPCRNIGFPAKPAPYADISMRIKIGAEALGLKPFHLPMAINYSDTRRNTCKLCTTCDTYACAIGAKNDLDTMLLRKAQVSSTIDIYANTLVVKIETNSHRVSSVKCFSLKDEKKMEFRGKIVILSSGALASPHLLLHSQLDKLNPAGRYVGRYLTRHANAIVFGVFAGVPDKQNRFHKELAIMDYYFGHNEYPEVKHKLGSLQQVPTPGKGLVEDALPFPVGTLLSKGVKYITGLLAIAEDQPQFANRIFLPDNYDFSKLSSPSIWHDYSQRDLAALKALIGAGKKIMSKTGSMFQYVHHIRTFSHSAGTVRMGIDESTSPLDKNCNFRGIENLYVVDACFMPTSAAVNPSLTISANALRVGDHLLKNKLC